MRPLKLEIGGAVTGSCGENKGDIRQKESRMAGRDPGGRKEGASPPDKWDGEPWGDGRERGSGLARPAVTLIGAMTAEALLKPQAPPSVHSPPRSRTPPATAAAAATGLTTAAGASTEGALTPRTRSTTKRMPGPEAANDSSQPRPASKTPPCRAAAGCEARLEVLPGTLQKAGPRPRPAPRQGSFTASGTLGLICIRGWTTGAVASETSQPSNSVYLRTRIGRRSFDGLNLRIEAVSVLNRKRGKGDDGVRCLCKNETF